MKDVSHNSVRALRILREQIYESNITRVCKIVLHSNDTKYDLFLLKEGEWLSSHENIHVLILMAKAFSPGCHTINTKFKGIQIFLEYSLGLISKKTD